MSKNYLLIYSEQLATEIELLCQKSKASLIQLLQNNLIVRLFVLRLNYNINIKIRGDDL